MSHLLVVDFVDLRYADVILHYVRVNVVANLKQIRN